MIAVGVNGGTIGEIIWFVSWAAIFLIPWLRWVWVASRDDE
jgi:hypothetical protein